jgi:hypothetical protein
MNVAPILVLPQQRDAGEGISRDGPVAVPTGRVCVDGKFFDRGGRLLCVRGITYGPIAHNTVRTYHSPPEWLLGLAAARAAHAVGDAPARLLGLIHCGDGADAVRATE